MTDVLESAVARLQLPIPPQLGPATVALIRAAFPATLDDTAIALEIGRLNGEWIQSGSCPGPLKSLIVALLGDGLPSVLVPLVATQYVSIIDDLQVSRSGGQAWEGLSLDRARRLLSQVDVIYRLFSTDRLSGSQVSRLLDSWESSVSVHFRPLLCLARHLGLDLGLSRARVRELVGFDRERCADLFPDGDLDSAVASAVELLKLTDPEFTAAESLGVLLGTNGRVAELNYLQLFHLSLLPLEDWDHPPAYLYEFAPRGEAASEVLDNYPIETANAALNLSKSVYALDQSWARTKASSSASSLATVLGYLETLPHPARREAGRVLRALLFRFLEVTATPSKQLPPFTQSSIDAVLDHLAIGGTGTRGVIEQRVMDACLDVLWLSSAGDWYPRGLGDPVNASNTSRRKLGDVEFQDVSSRVVEVYEIHGGVLTAPYVKAHGQSLLRGLRRRFEEEWVAIDADPNHWRVNVTFVAHSESGSGLPIAEVVAGVPVNTSETTFATLLSTIRSTVDQDALQLAFDVHVRGVLNARTTGEDTRLKYATISGLSLIVV